MTVRDKVASQDGYVGKVVFSTGLSAVVIGLIIWYCDIATLALVFRSVGVTGTLLLFLIYLMTQFLRALRFWIRLPEVNRPSMTVLFATVSIHQALNHILPARMGELAFPLVLRRYTPVSGTRAISVLLMARLSDLLSLTLLFLTSVILVSAARSTSLSGLPTIISGFMVIAAIALLPFLIPWFISTACGLVQRLRFRSSALRVISERLVRVMENLQIEMAAPVPFHRRLLFFLCSALIWLSTFLLYWVTMRLSGFPLSFIETVFGSSFANYANILPVNSAGSFGSHEAGWTLGFSLLGISAKDALSTGFVLHILGILFLAITAFPSWLFLRAGRRNLVIGD